MLRLLNESSTIDDDVEALVARAQSGDAQAFNRLLVSQYRFIYRVAFRVLGHKSDAEDVTQNVCLRLASSLSSFDGRASFSSWLYRVTMNAARDFMRGKVRRQHLVDGAALVAPDHIKADHDEQRTVEDIWRVVRSLPEKQRDAVILVHGEDLSHDEAAVIMGCKKVTVAWHLHNVRKALRELL